MKTITVTIKLTDEQFALVSDEAVKRGHNRAQQRIAEIIEEEITNVIEWGSDTVKTDIQISTQTREDV